MELCSITAVAEATEPGQLLQVTEDVAAEEAVVLRTKLEAEAIQQEEMQQTTVQLVQTAQILVVMLQIILEAVAVELASTQKAAFVLVTVAQEL